MRLGFIGFGSIARDTLQALGKTGLVYEIAGVYSLERPAITGDVPFVDSIEALIDCQPGMVIECASQGAVAACGPAVLDAGLPLLIVSIGALGDDELREQLIECAARSGSQVLLPAGAIGAIDALAAARLAGLDSVTYRAHKPANAWKGSAADNMLDLDIIDNATTFFRGNARDAARLFPKNSNVAATIALAGLGFDDTAVELIADPATSENTHSIQVSGAAGSFDITLNGKPSPVNPKTSMLTAMSVARLIVNRESALVI